MAVTFYSSIVAVHVMAVVLAFGWFAVHPLLLAAATRTPGPAAAALHRANSAVGPRLVSLIGAVALVAGIYLAVRGPYDGGSAWIAVSLVILVILLGLGGWSGPRERRLAELAEAGGGPRYDALLARVRAASSLGMLLLLVAIYLMVTKPG